MIAGVGEAAWVSWPALAPLVIALGRRVRHDPRELIRPLCQSSPGGRTAEELRPRKRLVPGQAPNLQVVSRKRESDEMARVREGGQDVLVCGNGPAFRGEAVERER